MSGIAADVVYERDVPVPLRDGTVSRADVYRPSTGRHPVLLARQSYSKNLPLTLATAFSDADPYRIARRGYAVVIQDGRGAPGVGGVLRPFVQEFDDGYDSVEWSAAQAWSSGRVGMVGRSYLGATPWLAAIRRPPSLVAIATGITGADVYTWGYHDGAVNMGFAITLALTSAKPHFQNSTDDPTESAIRSRVEQASRDLTSSFRYLPLKAFDVIPENSIIPYLEWLEHPTYDAYWEATNFRRHYSKLDVATLSMGGWFDIFIRGTLDNFHGMATEGTTARARSSRLIVGPWGHDNPYRHYLGHLDFGADADPRAIDLDGLQLRYFDYWLKDIDDGWISEPPVRIFVMGENVWRSEWEWPLARTQWTPFYLRSSGWANSLHGDGRLTSHPSMTSEATDQYLYDPNEPVPTWGGPSRLHGVAPKGPLDQRRVEARADVLVYTSDPLNSDVEVTGPIEAQIWGITTAPDTDFTAKLCDVYPDGRALSLTDGIVRARYRKSLAQPRLITPGEPTCYCINLGATSNLFRKGHRFRLEVSSSNFPRFDRNMNTGKPIGEDVEGRLATQTILHDSEHPSHLLLPIIPRG
jgi:putative CocE/NonD family hydrolase